MQAMMEKAMTDTAEKSEVFVIGDLYDGVIFYEDQTALSCFYCQENFNNCFFVPRREEKSE